MKITIKEKNLKLIPLERSVIEEKISSLDKFVSHINTLVEAFVEIALETKHHKKGKIYYAEVSIKLPGKIVRAEAREESIDQAVNMVKDELQLLLKKYKEIKITKSRKPFKE